MSFTYNFSQGSGGNLSSRTFNNVPIGVATSDRIVIVCTAGYRATSFTNSVTIGGIAATTGGSAGSQDSVGIYYAVVPSGTTANIVVNSSTNVDTLGIAVFSLYGASSPTPIATSSQEGGTSNSQVLVNVANGQNALFYVADNRGTSGSFTFSGAATTKSDEFALNAVDAAVGAQIIPPTSTNLVSSYSGSRSLNKLLYVAWA